MKENTKEQTAMMQLIECYFIPDKKTSSATVCANCGKEKYLHTIGEGVKATSTIIITSPTNTMYEPI